MTTKLPTGWVRITLGEFRSEGSISVDPSKFKNETFELYSVPSFETGEPETIEGKQIGSGKRLVEPGTVLICKINPRINRAWKVRTASGFRQLASPEWVAFRPVPGINPDYLRYFMCQSSFRNHLAANVSGVGGSLMRARPEAIDQFPFSLPPTREQARIVAAIDELFARLEESAALLELAEERCNGFGRSFAQAAYSGQLTSHSIGKTPLVLQAETRDDAWVAPFSFPDTWQISTLGELAEVVGGVTKDSKKKFDDPIESPYLRVANVQRGHLALEEVKTITTSKATLDRLRLREGDILLNEGGDLDKLGRGWVWEGQIEDCIHQNHVFRARLKNSILPPKFVSRYINEFCQGFFIKEGNQTTNLASVSMTKVRKVPIPVPTQKEAEKIDALCDQNQSNIDQTLQTIASQRQNLESLRQSILAAAFRGELVPQDPKDEPASVLLDRIRAQRAAAAAAPKARKTVPTASAKRKRA